MHSTAKLSTRLLPKKGKPFTKKPNSISPTTCPYGTANHYPSNQFKGGCPRQDTSLQPGNATPPKERHPNAGTSPQRRNVTPAKERHPSEGWGPSTQKWIPAYAGMTIFFDVLYEAKIYQNITHPPAYSKPQLSHPYHAHEAHAPNNSNRP